jgi:hypothetical protein
MATLGNTQVPGPSTSGQAEVLVEVLDGSGFSALHTGRETPQHSSRSQLQPMDAGSPDMRLI